LVDVFLLLQNSQLNASIQQIQLSAASSLQKREQETSRLELDVKNLKDELTESHRRLRSLEDELLQRDDQLAQLSADLKSSRDESVSKSDEVVCSSEPFHCRFVQ